MLNNFPLKLTFWLALVYGCMLPQAAFTQDWHPFPAGQTYIYSFQNRAVIDSVLFAAKVDSVRLEGLDSAYYLYRIDRFPLSNENLYTCDSQMIMQFTPVILHDRDHYFGKKMLWGQNGNCRFISSVADTFLLKANSRPGETWTWGHGLQAVTDSIVLGIVLGIPDSLKYISISANMQIVLSRRHGFVQAFNFLPYEYAYAFPDTVTFKLWGIPELGIGGHLPSFEELFSFDAGDRVGRHQIFHGFPPNRDQLWSSFDVLFSVPASRFTYLVMAERLDISYLPPLYTQLDSIYYAPHQDTLRFDTSAFAFLKLLPFQHFEDQNVQPFSSPSLIQTRIMTGTQRRIRMDFQTLPIIDTCANASYAFDHTENTSYAAGLGQIKKVVSDVAYLDTDSVYCYLKGNETFGNCLDLGMLISTQEAQELAKISIYPNPASTNIWISYQGTSAAGNKAFTILNANGQIIQEGTISSGNGLQSIDISWLPDGIYLLRIVDHRLAISAMKISIIH